MDFPLLVRSYNILHSFIGYLDLKNLYIGVKLVFPVCDTFSTRNYLE